MVMLVLVIAASLFAGGKQEAKKPAEEKAVEVKEEMAKPAIKNPDTFIYGTIGDAVTLDMAVAYDNASGNNMFQIYDKLIDYNRDDSGSFVPMLAEEVPTMENGGISADGKTYRFKIRKGVKFHSGHTLTPEDVEYSIERVMVVDPDHGPAWMYFMVFFDDFSSRDDDGNLKYNYTDDIDKAVEVDGDYVVFHLKNAFEPFMGLMGGYWGSITCKAWVAEQGGWDGTAADMKRVNNPPTGEETLYEIANGAGPYKLDRWVKGDEIVVVRHENYWGKKPALKKGVYKIIDEWSTRKLMFLQGDLDYAYVEPVYYDEMDMEEGIYAEKDLPGLNVAGIFFTHEINAQDNPLVFSAKLDGEGIPGDFFKNKDVRLAFIYAWDEATFLKDVGKGTLMDPVTPIPFGLPYKNPNQKRLPFDLKKSEELFKKAYGGKLWEKGFKLDVCYNSGNEVRGSALRMLAENISSLNPKFKLNARSVEWPEYLDLNKNKKMPIFFIGWAPDYPDPDNYADPFMYSNGYFPAKGGYKNAEVDDLVMKAKYATDSEVRKNAYYRLQELWIEDAVGVVFSQAKIRQYMRDWVKFDGGFFFQPVNSDLYYRLRYMKKEY
jgi:peptide/nickel transport system substrate-binding protein